MSQAAFSQTTFTSQLKRYYTFYTGGFLGFLILLAIAEQLGLERRYIGYAFLFATIALYAGIGIMSRTAEVAEYYVAGRRVPAFFNGMATGADWMSAASFIGMAGTLYLSGFDGLAFVMGWTGGYVLVALFLAPYLRKFGQFTIPDFLGARYGGNIVRTIGIIAAIIASFVYVVAQIYGVGLITSRFTGLEFGIGVFVGLAGILVCSMLGGMKAVTWTQVAQYIILIIAYLTPVVWLGVKHTGIPIPAVRLRTDDSEARGGREEDLRRSAGSGCPQDLQGPCRCGHRRRERCGRRTRRTARSTREGGRRSARIQRARRENRSDAEAPDRIPDGSRTVESVGCEGQGARRPCRAAASARRSFPGQGRAGARHRTARTSSASCSA